MMGLWKKVKFNKMYRNLLKSKGYEFPIRCCFCKEAFDEKHDHKIERHFSGYHSYKVRAIINKFAHIECLEKRYI